jgi:hypothetical protein
MVPEKRAAKVERRTYSKSDNAGGGNKGSKSTFFWSDFIPLCSCAMFSFDDAAGLPSFPFPLLPSLSLELLASLLLQDETQ